MESLEQFLEFSQKLTGSLEQRSEVIGLIFLGSAAEITRLDKWSDHDFFVITKSGFGEALRQDLSWLPDLDRVVLSPRETQHGLKVVYENGHVLEFAVFEDQELQTVPINDFAVALDRTDLAERMSRIQANAAPKPINENAEFELFLATLLIGIGRERRGEKLTAGQFVHSFSMNYVLGLVRAWVAPQPGTTAKEDTLNRYRRFEIQYPEIAESLEALHHLANEEAGRTLLNLVENIGGDRLDETKHEQIAFLRRTLDWV